MQFAVKEGKECNAGRTCYSAKNPSFEENYNAQRNPHLSLGLANRFLVFVITSTKHRKRIDKVVR